MFNQRNTNSKSSKARRRYIIILGVVSLLLGITISLYAQGDSPLFSVTVDVEDPFAGINGAVWHPDGTQILGWVGDEAIYVWDAVTGDVELELDITGRAWWNEDGSNILTYDYVREEIALWDVTSPDEPIYTVTDISPLAPYSPDKAHLITSEPGTAFLRDATTGNVLSELETLPFDWFWLDETHLGATDEDVFEYWDVAGNVQISTFTTEGFTSDYTANRLLTSEQGAEATRLRLYNIATGENTNTYRINGGISQAQLSADGQLLYVVARENVANSERLIIWDIEAGESVTLQPSIEDEIRNILAFYPNPDQTKMLTITYALDDENVQIDPNTEEITLWDTNNGNVLFNISLPGSTQGEWSSNGEYIAVWGNMGGGVWDAETGNRVLVLPSNSLIRDLIFNPTTSKVLSYNRTQLSVWELTNESD